MGHLTPTFGDQRSDGVFNIIPPHEPLRGDAPWTVSSAGVVSMTSIAPWSPLAPAPAVAPLKIALVGTAPSSRMLAPFNDKSWTIWGCSPGNMNLLPRVDAWFEVHSNLLWPEHESYGKPYIEWLKTLTIPVYMQERWPTPEGGWVDTRTIVPNAQPIPWRDMVAEFGDDFFTSSFAWMMALAMTKGAKEIALYGIDMASRDEYILQRPGFFYFRHEARRRGINVSAPNESDIMQSPPLYAISDSTPFGRKILAREKELKDRIAGMTAQRDQFSNNITYLQGALEDIDYFKSIWSGAQRP